MKKILTILSLLICFYANSQRYLDATTFGNKSNGFSVGRFFAFPTGCGAPTTPLSQDIAEKRGAFYEDTCGHYVFVWDASLNGWDTLLSTNTITGSVTWGSIAGDINAQTDLINKFNTKVNISDTAAMLSPYVNSTDNLPPLFNTSISAQQLLFDFISAPARTFLGRGSGSGPGDPSYISWDSLPGTNLTFSSGLLRTGNNVVALNLEAIWNTNEFQDYPIQSGQPNNDDIFVFNLGTHEWELRNLSDIVTGGGGGGGGSGVSSFLYIDTTLQRLATIINDSTAILKSININGATVNESDSTLNFLVTWDNVMDQSANLNATYTTSISPGNSWTIIGNNASTGLMSIDNTGTSGSALQVVGEVAGLTAEATIYPAWLINYTAANNTVAHGILMSRSPSGGNGADGLGLDIRFDLPDDDNNMRDAAEIVTDWQSASSTNHVAEMHFDVIDNDSTDRKRVLTLRGINQSIRFEGYGQGNLSDPPTYLLGVNATGDVLEVDTTGLSVGGGGGTNIYNSDGTVTDNTRVVDLYSNNTALLFILDSGEGSRFRLNGGDGSDKTLQFSSTNQFAQTMTNINWGYDAGGINQETYWFTTASNSGQQLYRVNNASVDDPNYGNFTELLMYNDTATLNGEYFWLTVNGEGGVGVRGDRYDDGTSSLVLHGTSIYTNGSVQYGSGARFEFGANTVNDADYAISDYPANTDYIIVEQSMTADRTLDLPDAALNSGRKIMVIMSNQAHNLTVTSSALIFGPTTLSGIQTIEYIAINSAWFVTSYFPD